MIEKFVYIIFVVSLIWGLIGMLLSSGWSRTRVKSLAVAELVRKRRLFANSLHTFSISIGGLVLLWLKVSSPLEVLGGAILVRGLIAVGMRNWKPKLMEKPGYQVLDAKSGVFLGELVSEVREWSTGTIEALKIRTATGSIIERSPDSVTVRSVIDRGADAAGSIRD
jgi:hypothetical protein